MLELGNTPPPAGDLIKDSSEATFMQDVVDASMEVPVVVDFWAPWCGPCKTLGPALEAAVAAAGGKVKMVKVDIDQNKALASQMQIQSIPAVFAFVKGQPVDGFMGVKAPSEIKQFIEKLVTEHGTEDEGLAAAVTAAEEMLEEGAAEDAAQTFVAILEQEPENVAAYVGLVKSHLAMDQGDQASALLDDAPNAIKENPSLVAIAAQLELATQAAEVGETAELLGKLDTNPNDHQARFDLASALLGTEDTEGAINELLELFRRDRDWNEDAARQQLFKVFESLGPQDLLAQAGRRKLSSLIFA